MDPSELTDISLMLFTDLGTSKTGKRRHDRVNTLLSGMTGGGGFYENGPPKYLRALVEAGLATTRKTKNSPAGNYLVELTDKGQEVHRLLMSTLRSAVQA